MRKLILLILLISVLDISSHGEIPIVTKFNSYSHVFSNSLKTFNEIWVNISGAGKYGADFTLSADKFDTNENVTFSLENASFYVKLFDFINIGYWYGNKKYVGYYGNYQGYFYFPSKEVPFKGWHTINGAGLTLDFYLFGDLFKTEFYIYKAKSDYDGIGSADLNLTLNYAGMSLEVLGGVFSNNFRFGAVYRTFFKSINALLVFGIPKIPIQTFSITVDDIYMLAEEKIYLSAPDNWWSIEQTLSIFTQPTFYNGILLTNVTGDISTKFSLVSKFLYNILLGGELIGNFYQNTGLVTQINISVWISPVIGFEGNSVTIRIQPFLNLLNVSNQQIGIWDYLISLKGEVKF